MIFKIFYEKNHFKKIGEIHLTPIWYILEISRSVIPEQKSRGVWDLFSNISIILMTFLKKKKRNSGNDSWKKNPNHFLTIQSHFRFESFCQWSEGPLSLDFFSRNDAYSFPKKRFLEFWLDFFSRMTLTVSGLLISRLLDFSKICA